MASMNGQTNTSEKEIKIEDPLLKNPWRNAYWFARMLINGDKYGGIGADSKLLAELSVALRKVLDDESESIETRIAISYRILREIITARFKKAASKKARAEHFLVDLEKKILSIEDLAVFILTAESVLIPINAAMKMIPSNDREFTEAVAKTYLDQLGEKALATVINFWDDAGVEGCLNAERIAVTREFSRLRRDLQKMPEENSDLILTAFVQEFERRLGQKRKGRAGGSLEDVTSFLFSYFKSSAAQKPEHFQADIEVDKWIRTGDKWLIGISCKRTLRERWKQVSSANSEILSKFKIKEIWHVVTYDEDLSDDKLTLLGGQRHKFYLRDDSRRLNHAQGHVGMKDYVRPMSQFIKDIQAAQSV